MALELSINVSLSSNGKTMTFTETTGVYNVNLNPTGWGSPNAALNNILEAYLVVNNTLDVPFGNNTLKYAESILDNAIFGAPHPVGFKVAL